MMNCKKLTQVLGLLVGIVFITYFTLVLVFFPVTEHIRPGIQIGAVSLLLAGVASYVVASAENCDFRAVCLHFGGPSWVALFILGLCLNFSFAVEYQHEVSVESVKKTGPGLQWKVRLQGESRAILLTYWFVEEPEYSINQLKLKKGLLGYYFGYFDENPNKSPR